MAPEISQTASLTDKVIGYFWVKQLTTITPVYETEKNLGQFQCPKPGPDH